MNIKDQTFKKYGIELKPIFPKDLPSLRRWRNSPQIKKQMIDTFHITPNQQRRWYENLQKKDNEIHMVIWCKGIRTGYMNIKGENSLERQESVFLGGYIGESSVNHGLLGVAFSMLQMDIAFDYLKVFKVKIFVRKTNSRAILFNKKMGYRKVDVRGDFIWLVNTPKDYKEAKARFIKYFNRGTI